MSHLRLPLSENDRKISSVASSARVSRRLCGSLCSPAFTIDQSEILIHVAGERSRMRLVVDGYVMTEFSSLLFQDFEQKIETDGEFRWLRIAGDLPRHQGQRAFLEFLDEGDGWFVVDEVRFPVDRGCRSRIAAFLARFRRRPPGF